MKDALFRMCCESIKSTGDLEFTKDLLYAFFEWGLPGPVPDNLKPLNEILHKIHRMRFIVSDQHDREFIPNPKEAYETLANEILAFFNLTREELQET